VAIPLTIFITLHQQHYKQEAAGNSSTSIPSLASPRHIIGGFGIDTTERAMDAANDGIQSTILYGNPPDANSTLGQTLASHNIKIIDSMPWEFLYKYENNKLSYTIQNMLTDISTHLQQIKNDPRIVGYWTLDDWPYTDPDGKELLVQINDLIHQITPGKPSIC